MNNLVYLEAIIKESLRLHPVLPLSVPHESIQDCVVGGFNIPKGTRLIADECAPVIHALHEMRLTLASLIQQFELQTPSNEPVDMSESFGITVSKQMPLEVLLAPRLTRDMYGLGP
ncbi:hypothetical protein E3N88_16303 [Mikania micrantha]|uniref:Cytochrome P450 n=1 Tax=Mikania micrantha TaxID=192012 RepID=A0A5N6P051_9ASTR|nr:hypothetical protein E3N88_16303 [Mikania micrantha]